MAYSFGGVPTEHGLLSGKALLTFLVIKHCGLHGIMEIRVLSLGRLYLWKRAEYSKDHQTLRVYNTPQIGGISSLIFCIKEVL